MQLSSSSTPLSGLGPHPPLTTGDQTSASLISNNYNIYVRNPSSVRLPRHPSKPQGATLNNIIHITTQQPCRPTSSLLPVAIPTLNDPYSFKTRKGLGLVHLNIRSILKRHKLDHLKILISQSDPDILVLTESWLKQANSDSDITLDNYNVFRIDRIGRGGGVAIYIKAWITATVITTSSVPNYFEYIALKVELSPNDSFIVVGIYRPPSAHISAIDKLANLLSQHSNTETIIMSDLNLDWLTSASKYLKEVSGNLNLSQLVTEPTRPNLKDSSRSTLIDLIFTNRSDKITSCGVFDIGISDHCPTACIRNISLKKSQSHMITKRNFKHFNDQSFIAELQNSDIRYTLQIPDVEMALEFFNKTFISIIDKHAPWKRLRVKNSSPPWFTPELSALLKQKNRSWILARKSRDPSHWASFRQIRNQCTAAVAHAKSKYFLDLVTSSYSDPSKFWKAVNSDKSKATTVLPTQVKYNDCLITEQKEIHQAFNRHFVNAGNLFDSNHPGPPTGENHQVQAESQPDFNFHFQPLSCTDVLCALQTIDARKSTGEDGLDPFFLKLAAPLIYEEITHIFNLSLLLGTFPISWKTAHVTPLHKGGDRGDLNNYRPISKLSCLAKIMESLVNNQVKIFLSEHSVLSPHQSGFREKHSTISATTLVVNDFASALD